MKRILVIVWLVLKTEMGIRRPKPGCLGLAVDQEQTNIIHNMSGKSRTKE